MAAPAAHMGSGGAIGPSAPIVTGMAIPGGGGPQSGVPQLAQLSGGGGGIGSSSISCSSTTRIGSAGITGRPSKSRASVRTAKDAV